MRKVRIIHLIGMALSVLLTAPSALADTAADLKQAEGFVKAGKHAEAEQVYEKVLQAEAANPEAVYQAGKMLPRVYLATDRLPQAREAVEQLLTRSASHERLPHALQEILDQAKTLSKTAQAGQIYQNILTAHPDHPQAVWLKMGMAIANAQLGNDQAVDATLQNIIARHGEDDRSTEALGQTAWAYRKLEKHDKARTVYQYVVDNWPKRDRAVYSQRGVVLCSIAMGDDAAAEAGVQKLLADYADSKYMAEIIRNIAVDYYRKGKLQPAATLHQYVVEKHPQTLEALWCQRDITLGGIDAANAQATEAALQKLVTGFADHTRLPEALADIGEHYRKKGNFQDARQIHQHVVQQFPTSTEAVQSQRNAILSSIGLDDESQIERGIHTLLTQFGKDKDIATVVCYVADRLGHQRDDERLKLYEYIIGHHPKHEIVIRAKAKLGQVKLYQGDETAAEAIFQKILTDYKGHPMLGQAMVLAADGYLMRSSQERMNGQITAAENCLRNAIAKADVAMTSLVDGHPAMGDALAVSGLSHMLLHEYENAAGLLKLVMERYPEYPRLADVSYSLATSYYYSGRYRDAVESYEHFLKRWPDNRGTSAARARLIKSYKWLYRQGAISREEALKTTEQIYQDLV